MYKMKAANTHYNKIIAKNSRPCNEFSRYYGNLGTGICEALFVYSLVQKFDSTQTPST